jgi:hypothetical protein
MRLEGPGRHPGRSGRVRAQCLRHRDGADQGPWGDGAEPALRPVSVRFAAPARCVAGSAAFCTLRRVAGRGSRGAGGDAGRARDRHAGPARGSKTLDPGKPPEDAAQTRTATTYRPSTRRWEARSLQSRIERSVSDRCAGRLPRREPVSRITSSPRTGQSVGRPRAVGRAGGKRHTRGAARADWAVDRVWRGFRPVRARRVGEREVIRLPHRAKTVGRGSRRRACRSARRSCVAGVLEHRPLRPRGSEVLADQPFQDHRLTVHSI